MLVAQRVRKVLWREERVVPFERGQFASSRVVDVLLLLVGEVGGLEEEVGVIVVMGIKTLDEV